MSGSSTGSGGGGAAAAAALRAAASVGDVNTCTHYLSTARCVRFSKDEHGRSALHLAASAGHAAVVRILLNVAAPREVDNIDGIGYTALQRAAADGHEQVLRLLLARGADVDKQDNVYGNSALHEAAWKGYSRSVRLLAAAGATLTKLNAGGFTALHLCCQNGHNQSCRELLLSGCNPDIKNNYGDTSLHTAARYGHAGVTRILISAQCCVSEQNKNGDTALHIAAAMGRRKLTRILLEAGCDKSVRNKQCETARDIALRKQLNEILLILNECFINNNNNNNGKLKEKKNKVKKRSKNKVHFNSKQHTTDTIDSPDKSSRHWSPYGCHYYPDPEAFPQPRLDSLPTEPLKRGEQYYLDLAGNICKGPVSVGYTCYCAPLFRHLEARLERDKRELQKAQIRLGQRVDGLEQKLHRGIHGRHSERVVSKRNCNQQNQSNNNDSNKNSNHLSRSKSLEMLDKIDSSIPLQATRSMDELETLENVRPSVKQLVARIQQQQQQQQREQQHLCLPQNNTYKSESSDDEDNPLRMVQHCGPMGNSNLATSIIPNYENITKRNNAEPRSRSGVYSPTVIGTTLIDSTVHYIEPIVKIQESNIFPFSFNYNNDNQKVKDYLPHLYNVENNNNSIITKKETDYFEHNPKYIDLNSRFAKLRMLDNNVKIIDKHKNNNGGGGNTSNMLDSNKIFKNTTHLLNHPQDILDRDTNNDSGYSTKIYGSSKGNSPSLSSHIDNNECLGAASSLV